MPGDSFKRPLEMLRQILSPTPAHHILAVFDKLPIVLPHTDRTRSGVGDLFRHNEAAPKNSTMDCHSDLYRQSRASGNLQDHMELSSILRLSHLRKQDKDVPELVLARLEVESKVVPQIENVHGNRKPLLWETEKKIFAAFEPTRIQPYSSTALRQLHGFEALEMGPLRIKWVLTSIEGETQGLMGPHYIRGKGEVPHTALTNNEKPVYFAGSATLLAGNGKLYVIRMTDFSGHYNTGPESIPIGRELFSKNGFVLATINDLLDQKGCIQVLWNVRVEEREPGTTRTKFDLLPQHVAGVEVHFDVFKGGENDTTKMWGTASFEGTKTAFAVSTLDVLHAPGDTESWQAQARQVFTNNGLTFSSTFK